MKFTSTIISIADVCRTHLLTKHNFQDLIYVFHYRSYSFLPSSHNMHKAWSSLCWPTPKYSKWCDKTNLSEPRTRKKLVQSGLLISCVTYTCHHRTITN